MSKKITKAVFPVAGLGTRFLPATKANPKEMLPIVDKPLIQYAVEEAIAAGIDTLIFITGRNKHCIQDHFDKSYELESELEKKGKNELINDLHAILPAHVTCVFIRQSEALGLGHAVLCAKSIVGNEPFAVLLADDLVEDGNRGCIKQLVKLFKKERHSILAVEPVDQDKTDQYGIVEIKAKSKRVGEIMSIIEKPKPEVAPSNLGVIGRYILTPAIFKHLDSVTQGAGGEIQLTDAIAELQKEETVLSYQFKGQRYDCGSKLGYLIANVEHGLLHPALKDKFAHYLKQRLL
ncbi:MAG: UTP--glucose-1-phosphate uridylyltransferase GalU [Methylococcales bacterium]|nr:UTP--glucose-1-phosphate uridylyltransferase GalU [Methylococcales bacterium]MCK5924885.1 UTP--glucose-1-phosphate uridylyltransferase GalU [Methylococcales bacterium]